MTVATATEIPMPRLSDSMESGTLLSWLIAPGAAVDVGDDLFEVETDKATMTVQAEASGVLEILVEEGETVDVGTPIGRLGDGAVVVACLGADPACRPGEPLEDVDQVHRVLEGER